jgi:hypothetical protein
MRYETRLRRLEARRLRPVSHFLSSMRYPWYRDEPDHEWRWGWSVPVVSRDARSYASGPWCPRKHPVLKPGPSAPVSIKKGDTMREIQLPSAARLFFELLAVRLEIKLLRCEIDDLKARLGEHDDGEVRETPA